jgi:hypothetical protein
MYNLNYDIPSSALYNYIIDRGGFMVLLQLFKPIPGLITDFEPIIVRTFKAFYFMQKNLLYVCIELIDCHIILFRRCAYALIKLKNSVCFQWKYIDVLMDFRLKNEVS